MNTRFHSSIKFFLPYRKNTHVCRRLELSIGDFIIDYKGTPVLIEGNMWYGSSWLIQMTHGVELYGDDTAEILESIKEKRRRFPFSCK